MENGEFMRVNSITIGAYTDHLQEMTLIDVLTWLAEKHKGMQIRVGTRGLGWVVANHSADEILNDIIPVESSELLNRQVFHMYPAEGRPANRNIPYLKPAWCIIIEGEEKGIY